MQFIFRGKAQWKVEGRELQIVGLSQVELIELSCLKDGVAEPVKPDKNTYQYRSST